MLIAPPPQKKKQTNSAFLQQQQLLASKMDSFVNRKINVSALKDFSDLWVYPIRAPSCAATKLADLSTTSFRGSEVKRHLFKVYATLAATVAMAALGAFAHLVKMRWIWIWRTALSLTIFHVKCCPTIIGVQHRRSLDPYSRRWLDRSFASHNPFTWEYYEAYLVSLCCGLPGGLLRWSLGRSCPWHWSIVSFPQHFSHLLICSSPPPQKKKTVSYKQASENTQS